MMSTTIVQTIYKEKWLWIKQIKFEILIKTVPGKHTFGQEIAYQHILVHTHRPWRRLSTK